jgi:hypothetical protein
MLVRIGLVRVEDGVAALHSSPHLVAILHLLLHVLVGGLDEVGPENGMRYGIRLKGSMLLVNTHVHFISSSSFFMSIPPSSVSSTMLIVWSSISGIPSSANRSMISFFSILVKAAGGSSLLVVFGLKSCLFTGAEWVGLPTREFRKF